MNEIEYNKCIENIFNFSIKSNNKFIFISGNGGSGKSTTAKHLKDIYNQNGLKANIIDTDDFVVNTSLRKNSESKYIDTKGNEYSGIYTTSLKESYCINWLNSIIYNLNNGLDCYYMHKHGNDFELLNSKADVTTIEGVGTLFIDKMKDSLWIYINSDLELEVERRIERSRNNEDKLTRYQIYEKAKDRRIQLNDSNSIKLNKFDLILESKRDYNFIVKKDVYNILGGNMNKDCEFAIKVIKQASNMLVEDFDTLDKGNEGDVVTTMDLNIEKYIIKKVKEEYPDFKIISEEYSPDNDISSNCVIINGIDGSVNVSKMMPIFGIQLAVIRDNVNTASVVHLPFLNELYYCDESDSYLNGKKIKVKDSELKKGLIAATGTKRIEKIIKLKEYGSIMRDYGSISVAFAWVASGKLNGAVYNGSKVWNIYPVLNICKKAGAVIIDEKENYIAASSKKFLDILSK
jgi:myo-inositol-1(or 4)-monophosphatase